MLDKFPARTQVRGDDRPPPGIGFQNGLAQGLVGVGRKHGEAATGDQFLKALTMDHALEHHIVQVQFSRQRLKSGTLGTVSCDD